MPPPAQTLLGVSVWIRQKGRVGQRYKAPPVPTSVPLPPTSALTQPRQPSLGHSRRVSPGAFALARRATRGPLSPFESFDGATFSARRPLGPPNSSGFIFPHTALQWTVCSPTPLPVTGIQTRQCWEAGQWSDMVRPRRWHPREGDRRPHTGTISLPRGDVATADCVRAVPRPEHAGALIADRQPPEVREIRFRCSCTAVSL